MISPRPGRIAQTNRGDASIGRTQISQPMTFPAPTGGLVTNADVAAQAQGNASVLENFIPTQTGARVRGGYVKHGLTAGGGDIVSMFSYKYGTTEKLFAASANAIFDMTAPPAPPSTVTGDVTGMGSGYWTTFQHTNSGVSYLVCVNGSNNRRLYDGSAWSTTPNITFSDSTTMADLNCGWLFANREFFLKNNSLDAYYLGVASFGGAATLFPLGGVMRKGGALLTGFSWSMETGDGANEFCCFVSTEGEIAVYQGSDPDSADSFTRVGVYQIGKPLGKNAWFRAGGDVLICTADGLIAMSQVFSRGPETLSIVSSSRPIEDIWMRAARDTGANWSVAQWKEENLVFITFPQNPSVTNTTFVMNSTTGKWSIVKNWEASSFASVAGNLYFGSLNGYVYRGDYTGTDDGLSFQCSYLSHFLPVQYGQRIIATMASMNFRASQKPNVKLFARADFDTSVPTVASVSMDSGSSSLWDVGLWDSATWDGSVGTQRYKFRQNVNAAGDFLAIGCAIQSAGDTKLTIEVDLGSIQATAGEPSA